MNRHTSVVKLAERYLDARCIKGSTLCRLAINNVTAWERLPTGRVTARNVERLVQYLSDNWPKYLIWPDDIPRPAPRAEREAA